MQPLALGAGDTYEASNLVEIPLVLQLLGRGVVTDLPTYNFAQRQTFLVIIHQHHFHTCIISLIIQTYFFSFWCLTYEAVPEPSCHDSHYIVLDRNKDMDELCNLLLVGATFSSDVVTLRELFQLNLQLKLKGIHSTGNG